MPQSLEQLLHNPEKLPLLLTLLAVAFLLHLAWFPGHVARKRRHPRRHLISVAGLLLFPNVAVLYLLDTGPYAYAVVGFFFLMVPLLAAYNPPRGKTTIAHDRAAERLHAMRAPAAEPSDADDTLPLL